MTVCNMSVEAGARAGMIGPDETTFAYLMGRRHAPKGKDWETSLERWRALSTDEGAVFDTEVELNAVELSPYVTWGTNPGQAVPLSGEVPQLIARDCSGCCADPAVRVTDDPRSTGRRPTLRRSTGNPSCRFWR